MKLRQPRSFIVNCALLIVSYQLFIILTLLRVSHRSLALGEQILRRIYVFFRGFAISETA